MRDTPSTNFPTYQLLNIAWSLPSTKSDLVLGLQVSAGQVQCLHYVMSDAQDIVVSQEKFDEMVKELEHLKTVRRTEIAKNLEYARSLGDLSENAEYQEARDLQAATEERIKKLEELVKNTKILTDGKKKNEVGFNSKVSIKRDESSEVHEYTIVGSEEADMRVKKLSHMSPLGAALMGKKRGDVFTFETPAGKQTYTIEKVA